jgi:xanthine dehydrogenase accessory factor
MTSLDHQVLKELLAWIKAGKSCWLCTIAGTIGSSPRPVGSLMACNEDGIVVGSLSGGCVEEDLIDRLLAGEYNLAQPQRVEYGVTAEENERLGLPCGGRMEIVVEWIVPNERLIEQMTVVEQRLARRQCVQRLVNLADGLAEIREADHYYPLEISDTEMLQTFGPRYQLLLVGAGQLAHSLADLATSMDYQVRVCDPRPAMVEQWSLEGVTAQQMMPDDFVREYALDAYSIVITLTHDPRIDDMALMEALLTNSFYVGALGSERTSAKRRERLIELDLTQEQIDKLHGPVGLPIGSKTPPEIAVAIMAELTMARAVRDGRKPKLKLVAA